ncbi:MAG: hypothetical protein U0R65_07720 [Candidatus Nanopelagicales bacterium]
MPTDRELADWHDRVDAAAEAGNHAALAVLYDEAVALFGSRAPHEWSEVLSAFDASAQTG